MKFGVEGLGFGHQPFLLDFNFCIVARLIFMKLSSDNQPNTLPPVTSFTGKKGITEYGIQGSWLSAPQPCQLHLPPSSQPTTRAAVL